MNVTSEPLDREDAHRLVEMFIESQALIGIAPSTIRRRTRHLRAFTADVAVESENTTHEAVAEWIRARSDNPSTQQSVRDSLRAFFRWATSTGHLTLDLTGPSSRASRLRAPEHWETEIRAWERALAGLGRTEQTVRQFGTRMRQFAREHQSLSPWAVTVDDLMDWFGTKKWGRETRRGRRSALRSFYGWAKTTKRTKRNPAAKLPVMRADSGIPRPATDTDVTTALTLAGRREKLALWIAADLGLRCGEVAGIHGTDLRERDGLWSLLVRGKGDKFRIVPVPESLARALHSAGDHFIFPGEVDGHISARYLGKRVNALLPPGVTMHMVRHRFATLAYEAAHDTFAVQRLLGHASPTTTQRYVQINDETLRETVDAVHRHRGGIS